MFQLIAFILLCSAHVVTIVARRLRETRSNFNALRLHKLQTKVNNTSNGDVTMYVLGDSHGDEDFLWRQLLSTGRFVVEGSPGAFHLEWRRGLLGACCCKKSTQAHCKNPKATYLSNRRNSHSGICCKERKANWYKSSATCDWVGGYNLNADSLLDEQPWIKKRGGSIDDMCANSAEPTDFVIVIAGDVVDRGTKSRECLELVRRLQRDEEFGSKLILLLGNHEAYLLRYGFIPEHSHSYDWAWKARELFFAAKDSDDYNFLKWLRTRPVIYLRARTLVVHGGLLPKIMDAVKQRLIAQGQAADGQAITNDINRQALRFYATVFKCVRRASHNSRVKCGQDLSSGGKSNVPVMLSKNDGILFERSYTEVSSGAGSRKSCKNAEALGRGMDVDYLALAHSTHPQIVEFCHNYSTKVFAVDTSWKECQMDKHKRRVNDDDRECDFSFTPKGGTNRSAFKPSSLHIMREPFRADACVCDQDATTYNRCSPPLQGSTPLT